MTVRSPLDPEDGARVALEDAQTGPHVERPEADGAIGRARQQELGVRLHKRLIFVERIAVETSDGVRE